MITVSVSDRAGASAAYHVRPGERLLHAGLAAGIGLPYECATGTCGSCKATVLEGSVRTLWDEAPGRRVCRRPGEFLMCQATGANQALALAIPTAFREARAPAVQARRGVASAFHPLTGEIGCFSVVCDEPVDHLPGQFMLLSAPGVEGGRAYSMTGHAPGTRRLDFLVRLKPGGALSPALFADRLAEHEVELFGPLGRAVLREEDDRPFLAIAGGSGLAGVLSIVEAALARGLFARSPSRLVFGLRRMAGSYMLDRLSDAVRRSGAGLRLTVAFSDEEADAGFRANYPDLGFAHGLAHEVARQELMPPGGEVPICFIAGPPAMVDAAMRMLVVEARVSPTEIRYDRFG